MTSPADFVAQRRVARRAPPRRLARAVRRRRPLLGAAARRAQRGRSHNALAYEDRLLLKLRIERLKNPRAHSQHPPSRASMCCRPRSCDGRPAAAPASCARRSSTSRPAASSSAARRHLCHHLVKAAGAWRIRLKRVDLLDAGAPLPAIQLFLDAFFVPPGAITMNRFVRCALGAAAGRRPSPPRTLAADLKVGLSVSLSGPNSSLGIPYAKGMQAALAYKPEINGRKVAADRARRRLRSDHRRPQRAQAGRGREGRRADGHRRACRRRSRSRRWAARPRRR